jgi:hypothetical protein
MPHGAGSASSWNCCPVRELFRKAPVFSSSSKMKQHGGARPNSGGPRPNSGGARANSGGSRANSGGARPGSGPVPLPAIVYLPRLAVARWYCLRTEYEADVEAADSVREAGFEVFAPVVWREPRAARRLSNGAVRPARVAGVGPMFRRYQFARFSLADPWPMILGLPGVDRILGLSTASPSPLPDLVIDLVRGWCQANDCQYPPNFNLLEPDAMLPMVDGVTARLLAGALADRVGISEWSDAKRTRLLLTIMGRELRVTVPRAWVEAA